MNLVEFHVNFPLFFAYPDQVHDTDLDPGHRNETDPDLTGSGSERCLAESWKETHRMLKKEKIL